MSRRSALCALAAIVFGCASDKSAEIEDLETRATPFIKLAKRGLGLVVYWTDLPDRAETMGRFENELAQSLSRSYDTEVEVFRRDGVYQRLDVELYADMVKRRVDDVIIVDVSWKKQRRREGFSARAYVVRMYDERAIKRVSVPPRSADPRRFANQVWLSIAGAFTDPAENPPLDLIRAADRLAIGGACEASVPLYEGHLREAEIAATSVERANELRESRSRLQKCKQTMTLQKKQAADYEARFALNVKFDGVDEKLIPPIRKAIGQSNLEKRLGNATDKPAKIEFGADYILLTMRYHPLRYRKAVAKRAKLWKGHPVLYLDPWIPPLAAILRSKELAVSLSPRFDGARIERFRTVLRLATLDGDHLEIEFGGEPDRVIFSDTLWIKTAGRSLVKVASSSPGDLRHKLFALGPKNTASGALTDYGLVVEFIERTDR